MFYRNTFSLQSVPLVLAYYFVLRVTEVESIKSIWNVCMLTKWKVTVGVLGLQDLGELTAYADDNKIYENIFLQELSTYFKRAKSMRNVLLLLL